MKKIKKLKVLTFVLFLILGTTASVVNAQDSSCDSTARGLYFLMPYPHQLPILHPSMPYEIMLGYIYIDSIFRAYGSFSIEDSIKAIGIDSDTMAYLMKYMYRVADYAPLLYAQYLGMSTKSKPFRRASGLIFESAVLDRIHSTNHLARLDREKYLNQLLIGAVYIYHIRVVDTTNIPRSSTIWDNASKIVYSTILDKIKGQKTPAEEYIGVPIVLNVNNVPITNTSTTAYLNNHQNYFAFEHSESVKRRANIPVGTTTWFFNKPLKDSDGNPWVIPNREYIVFARMGAGKECSNRDLDVQAVTISPVYGNTSCGMLPIINGNVIDEENNLGLGEVIPVEEFKKLLRERIDLIKNYGE